MPGENDALVLLDLSREITGGKRAMRWYQDSRGFDALYSDGHGGLLGGTAGNFYALEAGDNDAGTPTPLRYTSKFSHQGHPENQKTYQDLVVEHDTASSPITVKALIDNGYTVVDLGTIQSAVKTQTPFRIGTEEGKKGKNFALRLEGTKLDNFLPCTIYSAFLHYYVEARDSLTWDSDEGDDGTQHVKAYRAVELDVQNPGQLTVQLWTDMPGNNMALRSQKTVPVSTTRRKYTVHFPRPYIEGRHRRVIVFSQDGVTTFQLYGARTELQPFGEYVEGYESAAGREWDSGTLDLGDPRVKEIREVQLQIDTDGPLTFDLHTELPGLSMTSRVTKSVNTEPTTAGMRMVNLPLAADGSPFEGRLVRSFLRGSSAWRLYGAWLFARPIGYYVEAYQAADGHIWDSTVLDLGSPLVKRILQLNFEAHADSPLTVKTYTSNANGEMVLRDTQTLPSAGRKPYIIQLQSVYGRLARVTITSTGAFRLFHARMYVKPIGVYLNGGTFEMFPVEAEQDTGQERVKLFKEIELIYSGSGTLDFYSNPDAAQTLIRSFTLATVSETRTAKLRLPPTAKGRLIRMEFKPGVSDLALFVARVWTRTVGESGQVLWQWVPMPIPATPENYSWVDLYVAPTPPAWEWQPIYVPPTPTEKWDWVDLPVQL